MASAPAQHMSIRLFILVIAVAATGCADNEMTGPTLTILAADSGGFDPSPDIRVSDGPPLDIYARNLPDLPNIDVFSLDVNEEHDESAHACPASNDPCLLATWSVEQGGCIQVPTNENGQCDDGNPCTEFDTCNEGVCEAGELVHCDDGNPCTDDGCSSVEGCISKPNTNPCDYGDPCTGGDQCVDGACLPGPIDLCPPCETAEDCLQFDDGNPCTIGVCVPGTGCMSTNVEDGALCKAQENWHCLDGECTCQSTCMWKQCGVDDGCGSQCSCKVGEQCVGNVCSDGVCDAASLGTFGGGARALDIEGTMAYVASWGGGLQVFDISEPESPKLAAQYPTHHAIDVQVLSEVAYVLDLKNGLSIFDVSDPSLPQLVGNWASDNPYHEKAHGLYVVDGVAYVACGGPEIVDVSDASAPQLLSDSGLVSNVLDVHVVGDTAYVACGQYGLQILDVTDPELPQKLSTNWVFESSLAMGVYASGGFAYVARGGPGLEVYDVTDPISPELLEIYDTPGTATDVLVQSGLAYVVDQEGGLQILDVLNPAAPLFLGSYKNAGHKARDVRVPSGLAYLVSGGALEVVKVQEPAAPLLLTRYATPVNISDVWIEQGTAHVLGGNVFHTLDVSVPELPQSLGSCQIPGEPKRFDVASGFAYVASGKTGLNVIDLTNPASPQPSGTWELWGDISPWPGTAMDVRVDSGRAYAVAYGTGLHVFDLSAPGSPIPLGVNETPVYPLAVFPTGDLVFVADLQTGLEVFDVSAPESPQLLSICTWCDDLDSKQQAQDIWVHGDVAYVAASEFGLVTIDVSNPGNPSVLHVQTFPTYVRRIHVVGNRIYLSSMSTLRILDISNPALPVELSTYQVDVSPQPFFTPYAASGVAYLGRAKGLDIVDVSGCWSEW